MGWDHVSEISDPAIYFSWLKWAGELPVMPGLGSTTRSQAEKQSWQKRWELIVSLNWEEPNGGDIKITFLELGKEEIIDKV